MNIYGQRAGALHAVGVHGGVRQHILAVVAGRGCVKNAAPTRTKQRCAEIRRVGEAQGLMLGPMDRADIMNWFVVSITAETVAGQHTAAAAVNCTSSTKLPYIVLVVPVGPLALIGTMDKRVTV